MDTQPHLASEQRVRDFLLSALRAAGTAEESAFAVTDALTEASLRGVDSHGIRLLIHYVRVVQHGRINPTPRMSFSATGPSTGVVDADNGFGHHASYFAVDRAAAMTAATGVAAVAVTHSSHFGAAGCYVVRAALRGFLALGVSNSDSFVLPHNGTRPFNGTNPLAFAAPVREDKPFLIDMATSVIPWNRVEDLKSAHLPLPLDVAVDDHGKLTTDPARSAALLPLGGIQYGYKGAALAAMAEVLSAVVTGMPHCSELLAMAGPDLSTPRHIGHFFILVDPKRFIPIQVYDAAMRGYLRDLRSQPHKPGTHVLAPGDREWATEVRRKNLGIPISGALAQQFDQLADHLNIIRLRYG